MSGVFYEPILPPPRGLSLPPQYTPGYVASLVHVLERQLRQCLSVKGVASVPVRGSLPSSSSAGLSWVSVFHILLITSLVIVQYPGIRLHVYVGNLGGPSRIYFQELVNLRSRF